MVRYNHKSGMLEREMMTTTAILFRLLPQGRALAVLRRSAQTERAACGRALLTAAKGYAPAPYPDYNAFTVSLLHRQIEKIAASQIPRRWARP